jgi:hypothetical protein
MLSSIKYNQIEPSAIAINKLHDVQLQTPIAGDLLQYNGTTWTNTPLNLPIGIGSGVNFFPWDDGDGMGYNSLNKTPYNHAEVIESKLTNNNKVLIDGYISDSIGLGGTQIDAGIWLFNIWGYSSNVLTNCKITIDVYKKEAEPASTETLLFSVSTNNLDDALSLNQIGSVQQPFSINSTDRLLMKIYAESSTALDSTVYFYNGGTSHYSYMVSPLVLRHNDTSGLQGGTSTQRYHITQSQNSVLDATSSIQTQLDSKGSTTNRGNIGTNILAKNTSTQTGIGTDYTQVLFPTETFDTNAEFTTNTFTSKANQTVNVTCIINYNNLGNNNQGYLAIYYNGNLFVSIVQHSQDNICCLNLSFNLTINTNDTIKIYTKCTQTNKTLNGTQILSIKQLY